MTKRLRDAAARAWACYSGDNRGCPTVLWDELRAAIDEFDGEPRGISYELERSFTFEAAHFLPRVPDGHRCGRMHGHSYTLTVGVSGPLNEALGWVVDLGCVGDAVRRLVVDRLDHQCLNDFIDNPTSENLGAWVLEVLAAAPFSVSWVRVSETCRSAVVVRR